MATTKCMSPNSRASCSHCSRKILKGAMRVRAELYRWRFARCFKRVVFFHEDCYSPERTSWTTNQPNNKQQAQHMFQRACRLSVADQAHLLTKGCQKALPPFTEHVQRSCSDCEVSVEI
mmetsp:Transcript_32166/g.74834  ORF Transcript_32166/g.74834 Transcript_32166/m.74834 type:complete len:119 (-) Transcript_32166:213-569(-)